MKRFVSRSSVILPLLLALAGCNSGTTDAPTQALVPVKGKVSLKGAPLPGASVMFTPKGATKGTGAWAVTDASGAFELEHKSQQKGIEPGEYTVTISKLAQKDGSPIPAGKSAADVEAVQQVPPYFSMPNSEYPGAQVTISKDSAKPLEFAIQ